MNSWFEWAVIHRKELEKAADRLFKLVTEEYTAEYAAQKVLRMIDNIHSEEKSHNASLL